MKIENKKEIKNEVKEPNIIKSEIIPEGEVKIKENIELEIKPLDENIEVKKEGITQENLKDEMDELKEKDKEVSNFLKEYGIDEAEYNNEVNNDLDKLINEIEGNKAKEEIKLPEVPKEEITEDKNKSKKKEKEKSEKQNE